MMARVFSAKWAMGNGCEDLRMQMFVRSRMRGKRDEQGEVLPVREAGRQFAFGVRRGRV